MIFSERRNVFEPLKALDEFLKFSVEHRALCWAGDLDVAPEYIYFLAFGDDESLRGLFEEWGYVQSEIAVS